ncbi:hypothetical protein D4R30_00655 [archaeon]|nr:MAG: hypothetical protein D4R30_00655 [archaeon]
MPKDTLTMGMFQLTDADKVECQNCEWKGTGVDVNPIQDIYERIEPGETVPAGECPECGCLARLVSEPEAAAPTSTVYYVTVDDSEDNLVHGVVEAPTPQAAAILALQSYLLDNCEETPQDYKDGEYAWTLRVWAHALGAPYGFTEDAIDFKADDLLEFVQQEKP